MVDRAHLGPLVVQRAFYPEGPKVPHVYVLHPPGGLVGGDALRLEVSAEPGAEALVTTPAATKVYRSAGPACSSRQRFELSAGAALEWLPQEIILHDGARVVLATRADLERGARFVGVETICFGLPARGETFATGRCRQGFELWREGRPVVVERACFDAGEPVHGASWGLAGARVHGLMVVSPAPPREGATLGRARAAAAAVAGDRGGLTVVGDGDALLARYLGPGAEQARKMFLAVWTVLRPAVLGREAVPPRIWAT